jgi:hypothetical protein
MNAFPDYDKIKAVFQKKGYKFNEAPFLINKCGLRTNDQTPNKFNDFLFDVYIDEDGKKQLDVYNGTTRPGEFWLEHPMNTKGCAILKPGQYENMWEIGLHRGLYEAFVQINPCTVIRDSDRDGKWDYSGVSETGLFGIDGHYAHLDGVSYDINQASAGCQVVNDSSSLKLMLFTAQRQITKRRVKSFTYTLFLEDDFA